MPQAGMSFGDEQIRDTVPIVFAAKVLKVIEDKLVFGKIATKEYEGEINRVGDRVVILGLGEVTIRKYDPKVAKAVPEDPVQYESPQDSAIFLDVDQAYYYGLTEGDIKKKQSKVDHMTNYAAKAGVGLDKKVDTYIASLYDQGAMGSTPYILATGLDSAKITSSIGELWEALEKVNVDKKFLVLPPWVILRLFYAGIVLAEDLKGELKNGFIGRILQFDMYQSNQVNRPDETKWHNAIMAGSYDSIAFVQQLIESEQLRLSSDFADATRGLHVWGSRVIKPRELYWADLTGKAETQV
jgi:hypothetical protein